MKHLLKRSENIDETGVKLRRKLLEIYDKTVWNNNGWYLDDGRKESYLEEMRGIAKVK